MNRLCKIAMLTAIASLIGTTGASASDDAYADFPITLKGYDGSSKTSVSYGGQMARHMLHNGLKKAASSGDLAKMEMSMALLGLLEACADIQRAAPPEWEPGQEGRTLRRLDITIRKMKPLHG